MLPMTKKVVAKGEAAFILDVYEAVACAEARVKKGSYTFLRARVSGMEG